MELTDLQKHMLQDGYSKLSTVLSQIKQKQLDKDELSFMKLLESSVINAEICMIKMR